MINIYSYHWDSKNFLYPLLIQAETPGPSGWARRKRSAERVPSQAKKTRKTAAAPPKEQPTASPDNASVSKGFITFIPFYPI